MVDTASSSPAFARGGNRKRAAGYLGGMSDSEDDGQWKVDERGTTERVHAAIETVALKQNCARSALTNNISNHTFSANSASFGNLEALFTEARSHSAELRVQCYVGSSSRELSFSVHLGEDAPTASNEPPPKRVRASGNLEAERLTELRVGLLKKCPAPEVTAAIECAERLLNLKTHEGVRAVETFTLLVRKLAVSDTRARLVLAARLCGGFAVPLKPLRQAMGNMWVDGLLTSDETSGAGGLRPGDLAPPRSSSTLVGSLVLVSSVPFTQPV